MPVDQHACIDTLTLPDRQHDGTCLMDECGDQAAVAAVSLADDHSRSQRALGQVTLRINRRMVLKAQNRAQLLDRAFLPRHQTQFNLKKAACCCQNLENRFLTAKSVSIVWGVDLHPSVESRRQMRRIAWCTNCEAQSTQLNKFRAALAAGVQDATDGDKLHVLDVLNVAVTASDYLVTVTVHLSPEIADPIVIGIPSCRSRNGSRPSKQC